MTAYSVKQFTEAAMDIDAAARTHTGRVRQNNEDSFMLAPELGLFILSDGMGGLAAGEVASRLTVETVVAHCREAEMDPNLTLTGNQLPGTSDIANQLASAVQLANREVHGASQKHSAANSKPAAMGATVVAARIHDGRLILAHVGDSRVYRLRGAAFEQLTEDHSLVAEQVRQGLLTEEQARRSTLQNVLVRALGVEPEVKVDVVEELVLDGDILLLCSDGLTRELSDSQIAAVLSDADDADSAAALLIDLANQAGGGDNITAVVLRCAPKPAGAFARVGRLGKWFKGSR